MLVFFHFLLAGVSNILCDPTVYDQRQTGKTNVRVEVKDAVIIAVGDGEFGGDYDYSYDYSDLTIKPSQSPSSTSSIPASLTSIPVSTTSIPASSTNTSPSKKPTTQATTQTAAAPPNLNITQNAAVVLEAENNSIIFPANKPGNTSSDPVKIIPDSFKPDQIPVLVLQEAQNANRPNKFLPVKTVEKHYVPSTRIRAKTSNGTINTEQLPPRHCSPGFFLDNHNRCKRIVRPARERPQLPIGLRFDQRPRN